MHMRACAARASAARCERVTAPLSTVTPSCAHTIIPSYVLMPPCPPHMATPCVPPQNDIWALGVMVLEAYTGCHPFSPDHHHHENVLYSIAHHQKVNLPPTLSPEFASWLQLVLQRDPEQRPNAHEALEHPWLCKRYSDSEQVKLTSGAATQTAAVAHCSFSYVQPARPQALNVMGFECMSFEY